MVKNKLLSGRVKVTPSANVTADRYQFLGLEQAEPNLGESTDGFVLTYDSNSPGGRLWAPGGLESGLAYDHANAAYDAANNAVDTWVRDAANSASSYANSSYLHANAAYDAANNAVDTWVRDAANSASSYANSAYAEANNKLDLSGGTISGDLAVTGNLTISGNLTTLNIESFVITDPLVHLAANNETSDVVDIGWLGHYSQDAGATKRHAGVFRDATDGKFIIFDNYVDDALDGEDGVVELDTSNNTFRIATLKANLESDVVSIRGYDPINHTNSAYQVANSGSSYANGAFAAANIADQKAVTSGTYANSAYIHANAAFDAANNAVDTWVRDATNSASSYANSAYLHANAAYDAANNAVDTWVRDAANSASSYANGAFAIGNTANTLAQAAFDAANNAVDTWVRDAANSASSYANSAYIHANSAYDAANNATDTWVRTAANSASSYANSGYIHANSAFDKANDAYSIISGTFGVSVSLDSFTGDSACTTFTLSTTPSDENYTLVTLNGLVQHKSAYNVSGSNVVFSEAPGTDVAIDVVSFISNAVQPYGVEITLDTFTGDNSCTTFTLSSTPLNENYTSVVIDGVSQLKTAYNISGSNIVFSEAPGTSTNIEVTTYQSADAYAANTLSQIARDHANSAYLHANSAFDTANNATDSWVRDAANSASSYSNSAYLHANAAFDAANNAVDTWVRDAANSASSYANAAFDYANTYPSYVDNAIANLVASAPTTLDTLNELATALNNDPSFATTTATLIGLARDQANSAFDAANTADQKAVTSGSYANSAYLHANAAFDAANNAVDTWVRDAANSASSYANGAYGVANSASSYANGAFVAANTADQKAVTSGDYANSAYAQANTTNTLAQAAYDAANNAVDTWVRDAANSASSYANSAYAAANTGTILAQAAFDAANTAGGADTYARDQANSAFDKANAAYDYANGTFAVSSTLDSFTGDNACTTFTLSTTPSNENYTFVTLNGLVQHKSAYNVSGSNIIFSEAPNTDVAIDVVTLTGNPAITVGVNITVDSFTGDAACTEFTLTTEPKDENYILVSVSGTLQHKSAYSLSGTTLTFSEAPPDSATIEVSIYESADIYASNTLSQIARDHANAAYDAANNAVDTWVRDAANSASSYANGAFVVANTADQRAVTSGDYANSAYAAANNKLDLTGGTITGDLAVAGNLSISGNTIQIDVTTLNVSDPIIYLAANNYDSDIVGIGFVGNYFDGTNQRHAGLVRMEASNTFYLFTNYDEEFDTNTLDLTNVSLKEAELRANVTANTVTVRGVEVLDHSNSAYTAANTADQKAVTSGSYANSAYLHANAAYDAANNAVDTWVRGAANSASSYANGAFAIGNTANTLAQAAYDAANNAVDTWVRDAANSASSYANSAYDQANTGTILAQAAFDTANNAVDTWVRDAANSASSYANSAYDQANTANTLAQAAFDAANTAGGADTYAREHANSAYDAANTALGGQELYVASLDNFTSDGSNTDFTLSVTPANVSSMFVYVDGVYQQASAYTLDGNTLTLSEALDANSILEVRVLANTTPSQLFPTAFNTTVDTFSGDDSTTEFTLSTTPIDENHTFVFLNGVYQEKSTYSISGANVVLTGTATSNDTIEVATVKGSEINVTSSQYNSRVFTGDSACTEFTIASGHSANSILVFENGICQEPITDYTVSGTTLTFTTAPATGVKIQIRELPV